MRKQVELSPLTYLNRMKGRNLYYNSLPLIRPHPPKATCLIMPHPPKATSLIMPHPPNDTSLIRALPPKLFPIISPDFRCTEIVKYY